MFAPPSLKSDEPGGKQGTLTTPGWWGAGNWNTGAFDPETSIYYAVSRTQPTVYHLTEPDDEEATLDYAVVGGPRVPTIDGLPILKPPYGRITAIDMSTGEHVWMAPNSDGPRDHPLLKDLDLPPLGIPGLAAPLVTGTLLFIGEGSNSIPSIRDGMWGKKFRAYDKITGDVVWETELSSGTTGAPITYMFEGRQYILVAIGDRKYAVEWVALALPSSEISDDAAASR
jgi:quinoprotein glucose dehydrogenase